VNCEKLYWAGHVPRKGERAINVCTVLVREPLGKWPVGRLRRRWMTIKDVP
jgi:hypothetical protein